MRLEATETGPLERIIAERIRARGPMPFAAFMHLALYHPRYGYYSSGRERTGWRGHFLTSPELDPAFGELWARGFAEIWAGCGCPETFDVVEIGPGEGRFAHAVLRAVDGPFARALRYRLVERTPRLAARQRDLLAGFPDVGWIRSVTELPRLEVGCVFANEVLDNLPVHVVEGSGAEVKEVCVALDGPRLTTELRPPSSPELARFLERVGVVLPDGHRYEVGLAAESLVGHVAPALERGALIFVDYGDDADGLAQRPAGSLLAYSDTGVDSYVLDRPGSKDITAHANWTAIALACEERGLAVMGPRPQREVLRALGLADLDERFRAEHRAAVAGGRGPEAVAALSRRQALGALADPAGLGGLGIVCATRGVEPPAFIAR